MRILIIPRMTALLLRRCCKRCFPRTKLILKNFSEKATKQGGRKRSYLEDAGEEEFAFDEDDPSGIE